MRRRCCCNNQTTLPCTTFDCLTQWKHSVFATWEGTWQTDPGALLDANIPDSVNGSMLLDFNGTLPLCSWFKAVPAILGPHTYTDTANGTCPNLTTNLPATAVYQEAELILSGFTLVPQFLVRYTIRDEQSYTSSCNGTPFTYTQGSTVSSFFSVITTQVEADWVVDCPGRTITWDHPQTPTIMGALTYGACRYPFNGFCNTKAVGNITPSKKLCLNKVVIEF